MLKSEPTQNIRLPNQQADIAPNSPLAIVALFTEIVRERFREGNDLSWIWDINPTPNGTETNEPDAPRKILIAPSFGVHGEARNYRPAIYIRKGATAPEKTVINNQAGQQLKTGLKGFWLPATIPLYVEAISTSEAESATLADLVWFYLLAAREPIRAEFGILNYSDPVLNETTPYNEERDVFSTKVSMQIMVEFRWITEPISPKIREIALRLKSRTNPDIDSFLLEQYLT
jgi:hypothetical protein